MRPPAAAPAPAPIAAPFPVRFHSAQLIVTAKNERIRMPTKILLIIAISPFIEIFL
jgi:hypothetical protein